MANALNYLSLARKAGCAELGEEPVGGAARAGKAHVILVAGDASDHTWRRSLSYVAGTSQQCLRLQCTKDEMGMAIGRTALAVAAITDLSLALALGKALPASEKQAEALAVLTEKERRAKQRQKEAKAHQKNVRFGKKK